MTETTSAKGMAAGKSKGQTPVSARVALPRKSAAATPQPVLEADAPTASDTAEVPQPVLLPPRETKSRKLCWKLQVPGGATLSALMAETGWQAHTIRAALSGLRKKGWVITRRREGQATVYEIDVAASMVEEESDVFEVIDDQAAPNDQPTSSAGSACAKDVGQ